MHADQAARLNMTAVKNGTVTDSHIMTDKCFFMDGYIVLNIRPLTDCDLSGISAQDRVVQDTGAGLYFHVSGDHRSFCDIGTCFNYRRLSECGSDNHLAVPPLVFFRSDCNVMSIFLKAW
jgi:hypothetical protein